MNIKDGPICTFGFGTYWKFGPCEIWHIKLFYVQYVGWRNRGSIFEDQTGNVISVSGVCYQKVNFLVVLSQVIPSNFITFFYGTV